jgi:transcriptional regulator with XRE-family HTH domain
VVKPFGEIFREALRQCNLTQVEAAALLETSQSMISSYCRRKDPPRAKTLGWISARLGVPIAELKGEINGPESRKGGAPKGEHLPRSTPDDLVGRAMNDLKRRWMKKPDDRDTIKHLLAALFPNEARRLVAWLEED